MTCSNVGLIGHMNLYWAWVITKYPMLVLGLNADQLSPVKDASLSDLKRERFFVCLSKTLEKFLHKWKQMDDDGGTTSNGNEEKNKQIFILSGQSNMAGRGGVTHDKKWDRFVPPECQPDPNILRFSAKLHWEEASEPLHADIDYKKACGIGPGFPFAKLIRTHDTEIGIVGLVPCAVGGTAIKEWERGCHLYEEMVKRAKESIKEGGGEIRAVLWYQGESDTIHQHDADTYKEKMERLIENVRSDLGSPSLPFIQVAIASGDERLMDKIREAQFGIDLPNVVCVDAKGLELKDDHLHLTTEAQLKLGKMLADAYLENFTAAAASSC